MKNIIIFLSVLFLFNNAAKAEIINVTYAGFSFSGNYSDKQKVGKYTNLLLKEKNENGVDVVSASLLKEIKKVNAKKFKINFDYADISKGSEESVVMSVSLVNEDYSREFEPITKTYLNNIANSYQILFYDFHSKKLLAAIPFDTELQVYSKNKLTDSEIISQLRLFYTTGLINTKNSNNEKISVFSKIQDILNSFELKRKYRFRIGVTSVIIEDKAIKHIPKKYTKDNSALKTIFAHQLSSKLSLHNSIALVPFAEGMAIGNAMKLAFVNSDTIYDIELPKPDFDIILTIRGFKKITVATSDVRNVYLFGSYTKIQVIQKELNKTYFDEKIKNASQIEIPNNIENIDNWRKFYFSTIILFDKFSSNINSLNSKWAKKSLSKDGMHKESFSDLRKVLDKTK